MHLSIYSNPKFVIGH